MQFQPEDDINRSSSFADSNSARFPDGPPEGDVDFSHSVRSVDNQNVQNPDGDVLISTSDMHNDAFQSAASLPLGAQAVDSQGNVYIDDSPRHGPSVERPALTEDRWLHDMHLGKVVASATKDLLNNLKRVIVIGNSQREELQGIIERKNAVYTLLSYWKHNNNMRKKVSDLLQLLRQAGEPDDKYSTLINQIRTSPP